MDDSYRDFDELGFGQETHVCGRRNEQVTTLKSAVGKLVAAAEQVGMTVDDLIGFLQSGMSVGDLLHYVAHKTRQQLQ